MSDLSIKPSWTDERIETLRKMWEGGNTATAIAAFLNDGTWGSITRNAVIGKVRRLGFKQLVRSERAPPKPRPPREPKAPKVRLAVEPKKMRKPPKSANRTPQRQTYQVGSRDPLKVEAIKADRTAYGKELLQAFKHVPPDALQLVGRPFGSCAWPVGEPVGTEAQLCCGHRAIDGKSYCERHAAIAYVERRETLSDTMRKLRKYIK